ncbi:hypothetical protein INR49_001679 [Caranx melampygus]|nr:hypothetical protein INR49_001679 [Caranx melampygus]
MDLPETIRRRLEDFSRNVLFDQSRTEPFSKENNTFLPHDKRVLSSLHLQMSLYFNMWFFPLWWISEIVMLHLKYPVLPDYYKFILVTVLIVMTLIETIRLYLGYAGTCNKRLSLVLWHFATWSDTPKPSSISDNLTEPGPAPHQDISFPDILTQSQMPTTNRICHFLCLTYLFLYF